MSRLVDERRVQVQNDQAVGAGPVLYVMAREQRLHDNWALLYALEQANKRQVPLLILFALAPMFNHGSARHNEWMVTSLSEVSQEARKYDIPFFIECGEWASVVHTFVVREGVGEVVFDSNPLEPVRTWREDAAAMLSVRAVVVDARNIVPCFVASPKAEFAAYTFRPKITRLLPEFLTVFPRLAAPLVPFKGVVPPIDWEMVRAFRRCDYTEVIPVRLAPGAKAAAQVLQEFIETRLTGYSTKRNDPSLEAVSDLSPYLRWGNLSAATVALAVKATKAPRVDKDAFLEELIVRRELADNFCYYHRQQQSVTAAHPWAQATLAEHAGDQRPYTYMYEQFRDALTHDDLWNAAQNQLVQEGKMHGFMRMYWAKKILEWTPDVETALAVAFRLNDHYELDGRDSNGVVGIMWSICGVHDRAWNERPIFGKVRYMNYAGCKRKFDVAAYIRRYGTAAESALF